MTCDQVLSPTLATTAYSDLLADTILLSHLTFLLFWKAPVCERMMCSWQCECREKYTGSDRLLTEADGRGVYETGVVMVKEGDIRHNDNVRGLPGGSFDIIKFVKIKGLLKFR